MNAKQFAVVSCGCSILFFLILFGSIGCGLVYEALMRDKDVEKCSTQELIKEIAHIFDAEKLSEAKSSRFYDLSSELRERKNKKEKCEMIYDLFVKSKKRRRLENAVEKDFYVSDLLHGMIENADYDALAIVLSLKKKHAKNISFWLRDDKIQQYIFYAIERKKISVIKILLPYIDDRNELISELLRKKDFQQVSIILRCAIEIGFLSKDNVFVICKKRFPDNDDLQLLNELRNWKKDQTKIWTIY